MPTIDSVLIAEHAPVRTCVGCRIRRPSVELVRLTRRACDAEGSSIDVDGSSCGRGAWLCRDSLPACLDQAVRRRGFDRAWRTRLGPEDIDRLTKAVDPLTNTMTASGAVDETPGGPDAAVVGMTTGKG